MTIWIDADAAPKAVLEVVFRASDRRRIKVVLVANRWIPKPRSKLISCVQVPGGFDVADEYIVDHCEDGDLVITADIPLAAQVVEKGAQALQPRGEMLDRDNVAARLSVRDFSEELRASGVMGGGPPPYGKPDRQRFANALDRWLTANA